MCYTSMLELADLYRITCLKIMKFNISVTNIFRQFLNQARARFLEITFIPPKYVCVCVLVYKRMFYIQANLRMLQH